MMNIKEIKEMVDLMNANNLMELEFEKNGTKIRLRRDGLAKHDNIIFERPHIIEREPIAKSRETPSAEPQATSKQLIIKSPMIGTFYRAPSPDSPPFVDVGDTIEVGQIVCIVEAMKLMNEIKSDIKGRVVSVQVENGQPVEFGQPLFTLEPA